MRFLKKTKITTWLGKKQGMFTDQLVFSVSISFKFTLAPPGKGRSDTLAPLLLEVDALPVDVPCGGPSAFSFAWCLRAAAAEELPPRGERLVFVISVSVENLTSPC